MSYESRSVGSVLQDIVTNVQEIFRSEIRLAKTEITEEGKKAAKAGSMLAGGTLCGLYAIWLLLLTIVYALSLILSPWLSALIVCVTMAVSAAVLIRIGRTRFKAVHPKPERTMTSVRENVQWLKDQAR